MVALVALAQPAREVLRADRPRAPVEEVAGTGRLAGSVLAGSFRPMLLTYLWLRRDALYGEGRDDECYELSRLLYRLYPGNESARRFLGWFLAFDLKAKAPDRALAWKWAESGLDMLMGTSDGPDTVADWVRQQCGQNAAVFQRYAGPAWQRERFWRARLRRWSARHFGEELDRFSVGVRVLQGRERFDDNIRRALLLHELAYEELLRYGQAPHGAEALAALRVASASVADEERLHAHYEAKVRCLEAALRGRAADPLPEVEAYPVAMALFGLGAHARDAQKLADARTILRALGANVLGEEIGLVERWLAHVRDPARAPRPPLPFDGMP